MFLHGGSERSQNVGSNRSQFTYSCEVLNVRERQNLQDKVDVFNIIHNTAILDAVVHVHHLHASKIHDLDFLSSDHGHDTSWRAKYFGNKSAFRGLVRSDSPWQLTEGIRSELDDPNMLHIPEFENQILAQHGVYSKAVLVRDLFQCFRRNDGMILKSSTIYYY